MNFDRLDTVSGANAGSKMVVHYPDRTPVLKEDGSHVTITLYGPDSTAVKAAEVKARRELLQQGVSIKLTPEVLDTNEMTKLVAATSSWDGVQFPDDPAPDCTPANVRKLYTMFPDIMDQAKAHLGDRANFLKD